MAFIIDDKYFHVGLMQELAQQIDGFNDATKNAIKLVDEELPGDYANRIMYDDIGEFSRRDPTAVTAISTTDWRTMSEISQKGVKLFRKLPIKNTMQQFRSSFNGAAGGSLERYSELVGQAIARQGLKKRLNDGLACVATALRGIAANRFTIPTGTGLDGKINSEYLYEVLSLMGDRSADVAVWVMHSRAWHKLVKTQVADKLLEVTAGVLYEGIPATYGRPTFVTDSPALYRARSGSGSTEVREYLTLGLVPDAAVVTNSEREVASANTVMEKENVLMVVQAEGAWNVEAKGFAYNSGAGGANPNDTALKTTTNWTAIASDEKQRAGGVLIHLV